MAAQRSGVQECCFPHVQQFLQPQSPTTTKRSPPESGIDSGLAWQQPAGLLHRWPFSLLPPKDQTGPRSKAGISCGT